MMAGGLASARGEGTPQGGPLSPLLSNILLDDLDKELERRGTPSAATPTTTFHRTPRLKVASASVERLKARIREALRTGRGHSLRTVVAELT
jgi:retron-type reverse transcriptase